MRKFIGRFCYAPSHSGFTVRIAWRDPSRAARCMDVALLAFLILLNAAFAMSEMALTAARKTRLTVMVESGV